MSKSRSKLLIISAFFIIYAVWGSTYLFNKIAVSEIPPFMLSSVRFIIASTLIFLIVKSMKLPLAITKKQLVNSAIAGFLFLVYGNGLFIWGLQYIDSGFAALLASTQPLFVLLMMRFIDGKKMQKKSIIGVLLGLLGTYLLVSQQTLTSKEGSLLGVFIILTCVLSWSYASIFVSKANLPKNFFVSTGYQMLMGGILLAIVSFLFGEVWTSPLTWSTSTQGSVIFLIIFGAIVAFTAFNYLLKNVSPEKVATSAYVNPVIALILGWYVLDERLSLQSIIASAILLTGVYFITSRKRE